MTIKNYALTDINDNVVNVVVMDSDNAQEVFTAIAESNNAINYYDLEIYGKTSIGGTFYNNRLWLVQPYPSWVRGETDWEAPKAMPQDGNSYVWEESLIDWAIIETSN
jgi:hypothetical protein